METSRRVRVSRLRPTILQPQFPSNSLTRSLWPKSNIPRGLLLSMKDFSTQKPKKVKMNKISGSSGTSLESLKATVIFSFSSLIRKRANRLSGIHLRIFWVRHSRMSMVYICAMVHQLRLVSSMTLILEKISSLRATIRKLRRQLRKSSLRSRLSIDQFSLKRNLLHFSETTHSRFN